MAFTESMLWNTDGTGDGPAGGYSRNHWGTLLRTLFGTGVLRGIGDELIVSGAASPLSVGTGAAVVDGIFGANPSPEDVEVPTPSVGTTGHRIVLRATWGATQTLRVALLSNADGVPLSTQVPELQQESGVLYEHPLARFDITTAGVIQGLVNEEGFCQFATAITGDNIPDGAITAAKLATGAVTTAALAAGVLSADPAGRAKMAERYIQTKHIGLEQVTSAEIANRTRSVLVPAMWPRNETDGTVLAWGGADDPGWVLPDGKKSGCYGAFKVPEDFVSSLDILAVVYPLASGNLYCENLFRSAKAGETMPQHAMSTTYQAVAVVKDTVYEIQPLAGHGETLQLQGGDYVALRWTRDATNAADTVNAAVRFLGWLVTYEADS